MINEKYGDKVIRISKVHLFDICEKMKLDFSKLKYLLSGRYGNAYVVGDRVLKITSDIREANDVKEIIGKNKPGIVKYYDIIKYDLNGEILFCIVMERVIPLNDLLNHLGANKDYLNDMIDVFWENWGKIKNYEEYISLIDKKYSEPIPRDGFYNNMVKKLYKLYSKIKQLGNCPDFHLGNIGIDSENNLIMFDYNRVRNNLKRPNF